MFIKAGDLALYPVKNGASPGILILGRVNSAAIWRMDWQQDKNQTKKSIRGFAWVSKGENGNRDHATMVKME